MPRIAYERRRFGAAAMSVIDAADAIIDEYTMQGFVLTLRQLYYQFVSRDLIPNTDREYKRLGKIISDARMAGLIDWSAIEDRTRFMRTQATWESPSQIVQTCARQFTVDKWEDQYIVPEVWIEKDALVGVIENVCRENQLSYFSCRGYGSMSALWEASQRISQRFKEKRAGTLVLHLGDHDPSGIDMTRDIEARLHTFLVHERERSLSLAGYLGLAKAVSVVRLALNMDQVQKYNPPPNPAKMSDARAAGYVEAYGTESWELDALEPRVIASTIQQAVDQVRDHKKWKRAVAREKAGRKELLKIADSM